MFKISQVEIPINQVLISVNSDLSEVNGIAIRGSVEDKKAGIINTKARHFDITGTVLAVPNELFYAGPEQRKILEETGGNYNDYTIKDLTDSVYGSMEYDVEMELETGDKVWFDYGCHYSAHTQKKILNIEGHGMCHLIDYSAVFLVERNKNKFPVNGWIWVKHEKGSKEIIGLTLADKVDTTIQDVATIIKMGEPIRQYLHIFDEDYDGIKEGDRILYKHKHATPIEYSMHETEGLEGLFKIKRKDVIAIL